jgi:hypothetical protein
MLRTMEDILGIPHLNLNDASTAPMANAFDLSQKTWTYHAVPSNYLKLTTLPIPASQFTNTLGLNWHPLHNAQWWTAETKGMDFSVEDHVDTAKFNHVLWEGIMGSMPYPTQRSGADLRNDRVRLLKQYYEAQRKGQQLPTNVQSSSVTAPMVGGAGN